MARSGDRGADGGQEKRAGSRDKLGQEAKRSELEKAKSGRQIR